MQEADLMNILQIITGLRFGGAERMLLSVCESLSSRGHRVVVVILNPSAREMLPQFVELGVDVVIFDLKSRTQIIKNLWKLFYYLRQNRYDIIHCHLIHAIMVGLAIKIIYRVGVVATIHSIDEGGGIFSLLLRNFLGYFDKIIFISNRVAEAFAGNKLPCNSVIINNFIDFRSVKRMPRLNLNPDCISFCTISRIDEAKNIDQIIRSFAIFHEKIPNSILHIYGLGRASKSLNILIDKCNLSDCVSLKGATKNPSEVLNSYKFFVTACVSEGFGLSLLEAAAHGLFCIAVENPSHRFILEDSTYCYVFKNGDLDFIHSAYLEHVNIGYDINSDSYNSRLKRLFCLDGYINNLLLVYSECH